MKKMLNRFSAICEDEVLIQLAWRDAEDLDQNEHVEVLIGRPYPAALRQVVNDFEADFGCEFPTDLQKFLSRFNGVEFVVMDGAPSRSNVHEVATRELEEPTIWPALVFLDHFQFLDKPLHSTLSFFVIGGIEDDRNLCLGVENQKVVGIYWVEREGKAVKTTKVADTFREFVSDWCDRGLIDLDWFIDPS